MPSSRETHAAEPFRLLTLGGLSLVAPTGSVVRQQRRRLALLVLVSAAGDRGVSRDKLIAWLSPESTTESARHSLHQLLYYLRQQAGENVFIGSDPLRLNHQVVESDVVHFESAIRDGALEVAAQLYKGPFLDGFHLNDSPEFDEWASAERSRLAGVFAEALIRLAEDATLQGDHSSAIKWWRRLAIQDPMNGRATLGLMGALVASGDAPAALVHARDHETLVRSELGSGPDPEVTALVERIQATPRPMVRASGDELRNTMAGGIARNDNEDAPREDAAAARREEGVAARRNTRIWITSGLFAAAAGGYLLLLSANSGRASSRISAGQFSRTDQILVGDFEAQPRDSLSARAISEVLRTSLGDSRAVSVVSRVEVDRALKLMQLPVTARLVGQLVQDLAIRNGYEAVLSGSITPLGQGYVLSVRLTTSSGKELATLSETVSSNDQLIPAVGRLSKALRRAIGESAASLDSVKPLPQVTTRSLRALELFTKAQDETRAGRGESRHTLSLLREAIAADSSFAMAHRFLGIKLYILDSTHASLRALRKAERYSDHLTEIERLYSLSTLHLVLGDYTLAADEAEAVLSLDSTSLWALNQLGILDNLLGRYEHGRQVALKRSKLDSTGRSHLPSTAIYAGKYDEALGIGRAFLSRYRQSSGSPSSAEARRLMATIHSATASFDSAVFYATPHGDTDPGDNDILALSQLSKGQIRKAFNTMRVRPRGSEHGGRTSSFSAISEARAASATAILSMDHRLPADGSTQS